MDETTLITIVVAVVAGFFLLVVTMVIVVVCRRKRVGQGRNPHGNLGFSEGTPTYVNENISGKNPESDVQGTECDESITREINNSLDMNGYSRVSGDSKDKTLNHIQIRTSQDKGLNNGSVSYEPHTVSPTAVGSAELIYASTDVVYTTNANNKFSKVNKSSLNRDHATDTERHYSALRHKVKTFENPYNVMPVHNSNSRGDDVIGDTEVGALDDTCSDVSPYAIIDVVREAPKRRNTNLQDRSRPQNVTSNKETKTCESIAAGSRHHLNQNNTHSLDAPETEFSHKHTEGVGKDFSTDEPNDASGGSNNIYYELEPKEDSDSDDFEETCV